MAKRKKKEQSWFIFTNDAYTNGIISGELPPEDTVDGVKCSDGVERKLWKCNGAFVTKMQRNKKQKNLHFEIFKKEGKYGSIKKADFLTKKRKNSKDLKCDTCGSTSFTSYGKDLKQCNRCGGWA